MKKMARIAGIILLLVSVSYAGLAVDVSSYNNPAFGMNTEGGLKTLHEGVKGENVIRLAGIIGGVIFQGTAVPSGSAVGQALAMRYDPAQPDGRRLSLNIGGTALITELYDWEMIPVAQFVHGGHTACMTLFDGPRTKGELATHEKNTDKGIMWANFHPALGDTLIGLNLFFADAMLVNPDLMQFADEAFSNTIPGYHATGRNLRSMSRELRMENTEGIELLLNLEVLYGSYNSYIYTDYGTEISYRIENTEIIFSGVPSYLFVKNDRKTNTSTVSVEMNEQFKKLYRNIVAINPTIYRTAERTAQWAAFFRAVQAGNPQVWQGFISQIDGIEASPRVETPRYWLSLTERE
jgi:hypothetical protein